MAPPCASAWVWALLVAVCAARCCSAGGLFGGLGQRWGRAVAQRGGEERRGGRPVASALLALRAGSTAEAAAVTEQAAASNVTQTAPLSVLISTSVGSSFLDKKKRVTLPRNSTVLEVKRTLEQKFPGSPPVELQRLFYGVRLLGDDELVANLSSLSPLPLMLDMLTGTSVYNKTLSVSQALEAYASILVQQAYVGDRLRSLFVSVPAAAGAGAGAGAVGGVGVEVGAEGLGEQGASSADTAIYREMFAAINSSLHATYAQDIGEALLDEAEPETQSADTAAWRHGRKDKSPITVALAQEFDLNLRGIKSFAYYSALLVIFAAFGTNTDASSKLLVLLVPLLWVSKLRQLRLLGKLGLNLVLPLVPAVEFLMPLLAAPYQVLATEMRSEAAAGKGGRGRGWGGEEGEDEGEGDEQGEEADDARGGGGRRAPVLPVGKGKGKGKQPVVPEAKRARA